MVLDWIVNYVPGWIGPTAVFVGLLVSSLGLLRQGISWLFSDLDSLGQYFAVSVVGVVFIWAVANVLKAPAFLVRYPTVYAVVFTFGGRWIEGAGAIILYQKLAHLAERRSWPSALPLWEKVLYKLTLLFFGIVGSYAAIGALLFSPLSLPISGPLLVTWTVASFLVSVIGLTAKVRTVSGSLPPLLLYGTILMLGGVEVFNLTSLSGDLQVFMAGGIGYSLGYVSMIALWLSR